MEIFIRILKEIGIAILLGLVVAGVAALLFYDKIPYSKQIPESINYVNIDKNEYSVRGDVENKANATETYMSKASELRYYELIKYVLPGRHRPFGSITGSSDLPSEYVGQTVDVANNGNLGEADASDNGEEPNAGTNNYSDPASAMEDALSEQSYGDIDTSQFKIGE